MKIVRIEEANALAACEKFDLCPAWIIDELGQGPVRCCYRWNHAGDHDSFSARVARDR